MGRLSKKQKINIYIILTSLLFILLAILIYKKIIIKDDNLTYNQIVNSKTEQTALNIYKSSYDGKIIKWQGKIAPYSQINGIKFCIIDDQHQNIDNTKPCDWFWAIPKENFDQNKDWNGNWVQYTLKYYNVSFDEKSDYSNGLYTITGKVNGIDCEVDNKCIPNIEISSIVKDSGSLHFTNKITDKLLIKNIKEEAENYTIDINYPVILDIEDKQSEDKLNSVIIDWVNKQIADFKKNYHDPRTDYWGNNELTLIYKSYTITHDHIVNITFDTYLNWVGSVHGFDSIDTINYDLKENKVIKLADLFNSPTYYKKLSELAIKNLMATNSYCVETIDTTNKWIKTGAGPDPKNFEYFNLDEGETGLILYFPPYQIDSYAAGVRSIYIELSDLKSILNKKYLFLIKE